MGPFQIKKSFRGKERKQSPDTCQNIFTVSLPGEGRPKLYFCQSPNQCTEKHRVYSHKFTLTYLNISASIPPAVFLHDPTPGERREGPDCRESILFTREGVQEAAHGLFLLCCRDSPRRSRRASHRAQEGGKVGQEILSYFTKPDRKNGSGDRPEVTNE